MSDFPIQIEESSREWPFHCEMGGVPCKKTNQQCFECALIQSNNDD